MNRRVALLFLAVCVALVTTAALWKKAIPGEYALTQILRTDLRIQEGVWTLSVMQVRNAIRLHVMVWSTAAALVALWFVLPCGIRRYWRRWGFQYLMTLGCSVAIFLFFWLRGFEAPWYQIEQLMTNPSSAPIFGHRLLWVWCADVIKGLIPSVPYRTCFLLTQAVAALLAVWMMGRWSALYVGRELQWVGQVMFALMISLTFDYYDFYDISISFFYALCLYLLKRELYPAFVVALGLATLNHENALLLIPVAALETFSNRRRCLIVCAAALFAHLGVRGLLQVFIPFGRQVDWRIWSNLYDPFAEPRALLISIASLMFWWGAAAMCWTAADRFLRKSALLLPLLIAVTYLFGQFHEPRQFDASIPVIIGFILSRIGSALMIRVSELNNPEVARPDSAQFLPYSHL